MDAAFQYNLKRQYHSFHRDGAMRVDGNYGSTLCYEPNSFDQWQQQPANVSLATLLGLTIGKPVGISLFSWIAVQAGFASLPDGVGWKVLTGGSFLCGIGFTMAMFIATLALEGNQLVEAKVGILLGSALCAAAGMVLLRLTSNRREEGNDRRQTGQEGSHNERFC